MGEEKFITYRSCANCGVIMKVSPDSKQAYCSAECAQEFVRCPGCGRFFAKEEGKKYCCEDCERSEIGYPGYETLKL
jgi:hypothetical protein